MATDLSNGRVEDGAEHRVKLDLSLDEARALKTWLLKPAADGTTALEDENIKAMLLRIRSALDFVDGVSKVRHELEQMGFSTDVLTDEQIATLGRRISEAPLRHGTGARQAGPSAEAEQKPAEPASTD